MCFWPIVECDNEITLCRDNLGLFHSWIKNLVGLDVLAKVFQRRHLFPGSTSDSYRCRDELQHDSNIIALRKCLRAAQDNCSLILNTISRKTKLGLDGEGIRWPLCRNEIAYFYIKIQYLEYDGIDKRTLFSNQ